MLEVSDLWITRIYPYPIIDKNVGCSAATMLKQNINSYHIKVSPAIHPIRSIDILIRIFNIAFLTASFISILTCFVLDVIQWIVSKGMIIMLEQKKVKKP